MYKDEFYEAKFARDENEVGQVRADWNTVNWVESLGIPKTPSPEVAKVLRGEHVSG